MPQGVVYDSALLGITRQEIDLLNDDIEVLLVDTSYTFNRSHEFVSEITGELQNDSGSGYERKEVQGITITLVSDNTRVDCDDVPYTAINTTTDARAAIFYRKGTNDSDSQVICMLQGVELSTNGSDVDLRIPEEGIFEIEAVQMS